MAANTNPNQPLRLRYFNGLIMKEEEFILEQDYHVRMRRFLTRQLHSGGVVDGLNVTVGNTPQEVQVSKGFALDRSFDQQFSEDTSRELILTDTCEVDLSTYSPGDQVWIWVTYAEDFVDVVPDRGGSEPIHIRESAVINHSTSAPANRNKEDIPLAIVTIGPSGGVDNDSIGFEFEGKQIRQEIAQKVERVEARTLTLTDPEILEGNAPFLDAFPFGDTGDNGIVVSSERTRFTDRVDVDGPLFTGGNANFSANLQVTQNTTLVGPVTAEQDITIQGRLLSSNPTGALELDDDLHVTGALQLQSSASVTEFSTDGTLADNSDTAVPTEQAVKTYVDTEVGKATNELVASIAAFARNSAPDGWLECNGQTKSRTEFARLFAEIGVAFGAGDGISTFNLPDLRGEFIRGWDNGRGVDAGRVFGDAQLDQFQDHVHVPGSSANFLVANGGGLLLATAGGGNISGVSLSTSTSAPRANAFGPLRTGAETRPRNVAMMFCIKF